MGKGFRRQVCFDFDGVIHSYTSGWQGEDVVPDPVVPGIKEVIDELQENGVAVVVFTTRAGTSMGMAAVSEYLKNNGIKVESIVNYKVPAMAYVDDRAICFNGETAGLAKKILGFKPWTINNLKKEEMKGMTFGNAFEKVISNNGSRYGMRLPHWKEDVIVKAQFPDRFSKMTHPYLYVESRNGRVPWKETVVELFSSEWELILLDTAI